MAACGGIGAQAPDGDTVRLVPSSGVVAQCTPGPATPTTGTSPKPPSRPAAPGVNLYFVCAGAASAPAGGSGASGVAKPPQASAPRHEPEVASASQPPSAAESSASAPSGRSWAQSMQDAQVFAVHLGLTACVFGLLLVFWCVLPWRLRFGPPQYDSRAWLPAPEGFAFRRHWGSFGGDSTGWSATPKVMQLVAGVVLFLAGLVLFLGGQPGKDEADARPGTAPAASAPASAAPRVASHEG